MIIKCLNCNKTIETNYTKQKFCCEQCGASYRNESITYNKICKRCNAEFKTNIKRQKYCCKECHAKSKKGKNTRLEAMNKIGGAVCANCGCDEIYILEINHIQGDGYAERKKGIDKNKLVALINAGKADLTKYNVLCKVCNAQHYVKEVLKIKGHTVKWNSHL